MANTQLYPISGKRLWVAGHGGMVGSALLRRLAMEDCEVLTVPRADLDLCRQADVEAWMEANRPDAVIIAAAKVGGIHANDSHPAAFLHDNLMIEANIVHAAHRAGVEKLLLLGSSCIYPKHAPQPISEFDMLTGPLEPTNQWYAIAKISGVMLCQAYRREYGVDFVSAMPTNLYGPGDFFSDTQGHVIPGLMLRFHEAKASNAPSVTVWGSGTPLREFLHADDVADGLVHVLTHYSDEPTINVGSGAEISIADLAATVADVVGYEGRIEFDRSKPDGTPRKLIDSSRLHALGWHPKIALAEGLAATYAWYLETAATGGIRRA